MCEAIFGILFSSEHRISKNKWITLWRAAPLRAHLKYFWLSRLGSCSLHINSWRAVTMLFCFSNAHWLSAYSRGTSSCNRPGGSVSPPRPLAWHATALLPQPPIQPPSGPRPQLLPSKNTRFSFTSSLLSLSFHRDSSGNSIFQAKF